MRLYPSASDGSSHDRPRLVLVRARGGRGVVMMHLASHAGNCSRRSRTRETVIGSDSGVCLGRTFRRCLAGEWNKEKKMGAKQTFLARSTS